MYTIQSICVREYQNQFVTKVFVNVDSKYWAKLKSKSNLGQLYGVDISNEVYRIVNKSFNTYCPSVSDDARASKGVKKIILSYTMTEAQAKALGCNDWSTTIWTNDNRAHLRAV